MPGSNNIKQWNPNAINQESDAEYLADPQRAGGAVTGIFPSVLANKLFFQVTTMCAALGEMMATKGYVISDVDLSVLQTALANILTWADVRSLLATGDVRLSLSPTPKVDEVKINGALLSRVTYANLWTWAQASSVVVAEANWAANMGAFSTGNGTTTFRLPDVRGEFPRFFDDGRGVDAGRVFGRHQADELKSHTHAPQIWWGFTTGVNTGVTGTGPSDLQIVINATGGVETRPRNVVFYAFIKI